MAEDAPDAYDRLGEEYARTVDIGNAASLLRWDQEVMMPPGGTPARSRQLSTLSALEHETLTGTAMADALAQLSEADLPAERSAVVREVRHEHERAAAVPTDLVERLSARSSEALSEWQDAKADADFEAFAPALDDLVSLRREYADHVDPDRDPYEVLFEEYEPWLGIDTAESVFATLREELVALVEAVGESDVTIPDAFAGTYPEDAQEGACRAALDELGYDWERGRLDTAPHPFSLGTQFDARVTTRFSEDDPLEALTSTVHEFGHATYTLGLPDDAYGSPLGEPRNLSVHESQSRFWENHVGRTEAFWERFLPTLREHLDVGDASARDAYRAANRVYDDNPIRVEADELTYHMHVLLRFEIERDLIRGELDAAEVPRVWNEKMAEYLGFRPEDDAVGCLQDIHWAHGDFGYFPTYTLGSVLAAQLDHHMRQDVAVDERVRAGEFGPIHDWLTEKIHRHGKRYETDDLVREATGESFTAEYFVDYATEKYGALYDL